MTELKIGDEITTLAQMNALPVGSVIRTDMARVAEVIEGPDPRNGHPHSDWYETGSDIAEASPTFSDFPHTLLYLGSRP